MVTNPNFKFKKIVTTAKTEYMKWILNSRLIILAVLVIFIFTFAVQPLLEISERLNTPLNIFEPFIAIISAEALVIMIPAVFITLIADFPRTDGTAAFIIMRTGRVNWYIGQVLFILAAIITFMGIIFTASVVPIFTKAFLANGWSLAVTRFTHYYPELSESFTAKLITKELYNQVSPYEAATKSFFLMTLYLFVLAMVMMFMNTIKKKTMGLIISSGIIAIGGALCIINSSAMWLFPMSHTIIYLHYTEYFKEPVVPFYISYIYLAICCVLLFSISFINIRNISFDSFCDINDNN
ncbi:MAG: hypothetical protein FWG90_07755 [Oscillospiraceae bacterium]|nr:hypothetical protein [Oscillospiraceae bacterium]